MSLFRKPTSADITTELARLQEQRNDAQSRLDAAQTVVAEADSVDATEQALAKVASMAGVVATLDAKITAAEAKLRDLTLAPLIARRAELANTLALDLAGFASEMAELVGIETATRIALGDALDLQRQIITKSRSSIAEFNALSAQLGLPKSNATPIDSTVLRVARCEVVRKLRQHFIDDHGKLGAATTGLESEGFQVAQESRDRRTAVAVSARHDARTPAHIALPGLATPARGVA